MKRKLLPRQQQNLLAEKAADRVEKSIKSQGHDIDSILVEKSRLVNSYIQEQASILGVSKNLIKQKLAENANLRAK